DHLFLIALAQGEEALAHAYANCSPSNLAEMYYITEPVGHGADLAPWEIPWLLRRRQPPPGECGLGPEHGTSYFGPCTAQKVALEYHRLTSVVDSIRQHGYRPDDHGHIEGFFLRSGDDFRFFVMGG